MTIALTLADIPALPDYLARRETLRAEVLATKRHRIVRIGENITLLFENRATVLYQILEMMRIEGGLPGFGKDMDERTLLPELGRPEMVSHEKGCYLGQETVARVHSRGRVHRLLLGLEIEGDRVPEPGTLATAISPPARLTVS